ncbi:MAG: hypothetical protein CUN52_10525 [Phototrophicales bacterium]|nr:MAG: hypothetical protein CUN52_10525 [Phototrophicales bacterium]
MIDKLDISILIANCLKMLKANHYKPCDKPAPKNQVKLAPLAGFNNRIAIGSKPMAKLLLDRIAKFL